MFNYQGKTALITGASSGIGEAFAQELAARRMNLILVARSEDKLQMLATTLRQKHGIRTEVMVADLSREETPSEVYKTVQQKHLTVDLLINNAGFLNYAPFEEIAPMKDRDQVMLNVASLVELTHYFVPGMLDRGNGGVINVSSNGAFHPMPYMAVYGASKAFVLSFSEALWAEYRNRGLSVVALCPGPTATAALLTELVKGKTHTPKQVAIVGLKALEANQNQVIPGLNNNLMVHTLFRLLPHRIVAQLVARVTRPRKRISPAN